MKGGGTPPLCLGKGNASNASKAKNVASNFRFNGDSWPLCLQVNS